jgi:demethylmenaquinone methyltransferase/2-methoxy-6-polyprenyl-1,4-benzoquinol methylase
MFAAIPVRYDLLNRILTWGFDERWRRQAACECLAGAPERVLDICCGTGDLTLHLAKLAEPGCEVVGLDFAEPMLEVARAKAAKSGLSQRVTFVHGDAASLMFPDGHFDAVGISFALRNITFQNPLRTRYLAEIARVVKPGGKFVVVETSQPRNRLLRMAFHFYMKQVVSGIGGLISGHRPAYRYLAESARLFYKPEELTALLKEAGFREVRSRPLLGGIAAIHVAR